MLEYFAVKNYKCLADVEIPLTPIHVIIGQNDSGKTSLLEAIQILSKTFSEDKLTDAFPGDWKGHDLVFEGAKEPIIEFTARLGRTSRDDDNLKTYHLQVKFSSKSRSCKRVEEWVDNGDLVHIQRRINPGAVARGISLDLQENNGAEKLADFSEKLGHAELYRFDPQIMAMPAAMNPSRKFRLDPDGFGLATLLDDILGYDAERFLKLRQRFCDFFPQFRSVRLETQSALARQYKNGILSGLSSSPGKGIILETVRGRAIRAEQASDGAILFLGFLALSYSPELPRILLVEEPEKGVYPKRLEEIIDLLRKLQEGPSAPQIIMTTHSPYILSFFQPEEVTFMIRKGRHGPIRARPLRDAPYIEERLGHGKFYLGELWYNLSEEELFADV